MCRIIEVHVQQGGEYECTHYLVHEPKDHSQWDDCRATTMPEFLYLAIRHAQQAQKMAEEFLADLYDSTGRESAIRDTRP